MSEDTPQPEAPAISGEPLVMPQDEFEALKAVAEATGAESWTREQVAEFQERFREAMANPGPLIVLPSEHWRERAVAAEARLAIAVRALSGIRAVVGTSTEAYHMARDALAIIGTEKDGGDAGDDSFTDPVL